MGQVANRQVVTEWFQLLQQVDPTPLPSFPPPPSPRPSLTASFRRYTHTPISHPPTRRADEGHWGRQPNRSSCLDALALLPYSRATPRSLLPFYSIPRFQFRWQLTVASLCLYKYLAPTMSKMVEFKLKAVVLHQVKITVKSELNGVLSTLQPNVVMGFYIFCASSKK